MTKPAVMQKYFIYRLLFIPFGAIALIITKYAQCNPKWTEQVYSRTIYPLLSTASGYLPSFVHISIIEWLAVLCLLFCLGYLVYYVRKAIKNKDGRRMIIYHGVSGAAAIFSIAYFLFTAFCGLNYYRYPLAYYTGYDTAHTSIEELDQLCISLADEMVLIRKQLGDDKNLYTPGQGDFNYYAQHSVQMIHKLAEQYPILDRTLYSQPKPVVMSGLMSSAGIGGIFVPFTMESNININMPFFAQPSTMAHELGHQSGFMREDEANFIAYLVCKQSDDFLMHYSGLFLAFDHSISALERADPDRAAEIIISLSHAVQHDISLNKQFWNKHEGLILQISHFIMNTYLKSNNQTDGINSYGRMVDLLLAERRTQ